MLTGYGDDVATETAGSNNSDVQTKHLMLNRWKEREEVYCKLLLGHGD